MAQLRLDKFLANMSVGTRSEVKQLIRKGQVMVNGETAKKPEQKVTEKDGVFVNGQEISYCAKQYYMLNKPAGVVSATEDSRYKTVLDCIEGGRKDLFPVGRLDIDTEGLLLLTNDGELAHQLLSPKKHVPKVYYAKINGNVTKREVEIFQEGIDLGDFQTLPAILTVLSAGEKSEIQVTIFEGKFHQVKRMFEAVGMEVMYLKRLSMGTLNLDRGLKAGEYRHLTEQELLSLELQFKE